MNIYRDATDKVSLGAKFSIDLKNRSFRLDGKYIIKNGETAEDLSVSPDDLDLGDIDYSNPYAVIECLYEQYKYSVPSARTDAMRRNYFLALPFEDISNEDMLYAMRREEAQIRLELYVLISLINGSLQWLNPNRYFWQSQRDPDLVILRDRIF